MEDVISIIKNYFPTLKLRYEFDKNDFQYTISEFHRHIFCRIHHKDIFIINNLELDEDNIIVTSSYSLDDYAVFSLTDYDNINKYLANVYKKIKTLNNIAKKREIEEFYEQDEI